MKRFMTKRVAVVGAVAGLVLGLSGAAFAYWTTGGTGGGEGAVATSGGTVTLVASFPSGELTPGGDVPVTISAYNTGSTNLYVTSVSDAVIPIAVSAGCNLGDFSLQTSPTMDPAGGIEIPANTGSSAAIEVATDTLSYANTSVDQSACKGGTVTLSYTSS